MTAKEERSKSKSAPTVPAPKTAPEQKETDALIADMNRQFDSQLKCREKFMQAKTASARRKALAEFQVLHPDIWKVDPWFQRELNFVKDEESLSPIKSNGILNSEPDTAKRRIIVWQNQNINACGMCLLFDAANIPLTKKMRGAKDWSEAYRSRAHRKAIDVLIYRDRKALRVAP
jgi:hypothetical protein